MVFLTIIALGIALFLFLLSTILSIKNIKDHKTKKEAYNVPMFVLMGMFLYITLVLVFILSGGYFNV